jgi:hypothetical protein
MIRVGRDVSKTRPLELIPAKTARRMMSIRLTKSPFDNARRYDHIETRNRSRVLTVFVLPS